MSTKRVRVVAVVGRDDAEGATRRLVEATGARALDLVAGADHMAAARSVADDVRRSCPGTAVRLREVAAGADLLAWRDALWGPGGDPRPDEALSDAEQQLTFGQFRDMMDALTPVHELVRSLRGDPIPSGAALGIGANGGNGGLARH